jgi:glycosyltransferase involved in cell wall biosynthesis
MKILHIIPGSGGTFYCGNCLRDSKYVDALRKMGHEVVKLPMYLPLFGHEENGEVPVFYGAIETYLQQLFPFLKKAPKWFTRFLNSRPLLKMAAGMAGSTDAKGLDEMTVSMLLGEDGKQKEELERMVTWIADHYKPDVIHISNALLLGFAPRLKAKLGSAIVCSLQDEDGWVDVMDQEHQDKIWELMHEKAESVDAFIGVSEYYSDLMQKRMDLPVEKIHSMYLGVDLEEYTVRPIKDKPRNIGFISRLCYDNGLDILIDAFIKLKKMPENGDVKLKLTGGLTGADKKFIKRQKKKIKAAGLEDQVDFKDDFEEDGRLEFFEEVSLLSVPVRKEFAFGLYLLEAMASGVPVLQPNEGAFPEVIGLSGGGEIYEPNTADVLADKLNSLLSQPEKLERLSSQARSGVDEKFNIETKAEEVVKLYEDLISQIK